MFFGGDPFQHFGHGGGGHGGYGGHGMGGRGSSGPVDNEGLYECLGLAKDADENEIKKAYKKLALKHHPDKGGDVEKFKEISAAAEILSDPEKRRIYDQHGLAGLEGQGEGGGGDDIFSALFGGGRRRGPTGPQKGEDIVHPLRANLEDLYNGKSSRLAINRQKLCEECEGRGGSNGCERDCADCRGHGVRIQLRQIGPGMVQQVQSVCHACEGKGKIIDEKDKCKSCKGKKTYRDRKVLEVVIEKGMKNGSKIRFSGEADELPGTIPGDVIFVVQEKEHEIYQRKGADLLMTMELELSEALCGFVKTIRHLDGRLIKIESPVGKVILPDSLHCIQGEGMPYPGNPFTKGRLFINFKVNFPESIAQPAIASILSVLPAPPAVVLTNEEEECAFEEVDISEFGQGNERAYEAHDDDEDERGGGGGGVQCQSS